MGILTNSLLLGLLNSYIEKRQIRTKQFTRDVIDTLGNRIEEIVLPISKSASLRKAISKAISEVIHTRLAAGVTVGQLAGEITR